MPDPAPDEVYTQPPAFSGGEFRTTEFLPNLAAARDYAANLMGGAYDAFLGRAWYELRISQIRDPDGKFGKGFTVNTRYRRPADGEAY